ncbi:precorrin-6Y C5,15-methyltransferase (decarboxylating) subunit CbiT [Neotabrizicola shimadae]|uniref:Precorrin-6Y C5,15-methyltransferase (Decarboxylating) subunit CbiT n=1 Tax=Neotabrizicola shimadae TaxID=2807096 RepID=A0A8G0ZWJ8_9RHOB|nr:precorrin-6Y C5,15-methyltransferase (decarboxylating) subunit CbiT [Neotabrizicola shimadae]QYZ71462.1 precorrin-6Y C5,15-methyltransferase (decarboxylating) subunit CbiT [Neotabrizicola shimadae]
MSDPWLTILGIGEDGLNGLSEASRAALAGAEVIFGGPRHLALAGAGEKGRDWPVPFSVAPVLAERGRPVVVLASGDPFWFGAGGSLMASLSPGEWVARPVAGTFSLMAARLGLRLEDCACLGLHAAPFERLVPVLARGVTALVLLRDGAAVPALAAWLAGHSWGASRLTVMEALGGSAERIRQAGAEGFDLEGIAAPVAVAIQAQGEGLSRASGLPDDLFRSDGQMTKRPVRALALSALGPRPGELMWDIGAGSGSISVEWCLAGGRALAIEQKPERAANIRANAASFGLTHRLSVVEGEAPAALSGLEPPQAVFIGGGGDEALMSHLWDRLARGTRIVAHGVTLETEALFARWHGLHGGELMRVDIARAAPLGRMTGWVPARPVVQWSVTR